MQQRVLARLQKNALTGYAQKKAMKHLLTLDLGRFSESEKNTKKILSDVKTFYICPTINFQKNHYEQS
jgi:hypothetical protein